jgi:ABC-2 type transport system permease protein
MRTLGALVKTRLLALRDSFLWYFLSGVLFPFLLLFFANQLNPDPNARLQLIAGAITSSAVLSTVFLFGQSFAAQRFRGEYELYATLPISKWTFVFGLLGTNLLTSSVGIVTLLLLSVILYKIPITLSLWLVPILVLGAMSVAGIGLLIGVLSRDPGEAALVCNLAVYLLAYVSPVFYSADVLPPVIRELGWILPTSQVSSAVRASLSGFEFPFISMLMLFIWSISLLLFVILKLDWRLK